MQTRAQSGKEQSAGIEAAIAQVDEILRLRCAAAHCADPGRHCAARAPRVRPQRRFANVADAFAPAAEDAGKRLDAKIKPAIRFVGDRELLTQMLANLVENAIRHTPVGTRIEVALGSDHERIVGMVMDNGPGAPAEERERISQRSTGWSRAARRRAAGSASAWSRQWPICTASRSTCAMPKPGSQIVMDSPERH